MNYRQTCPPPARPSGWGRGRFGEQTLGCLPSGAAPGAYLLFCNSGMGTKRAGGLSKERRGECVLTESVSGLGASRKPLACTAGLGSLGGPRGKCGVREAGPLSSSPLLGGGDCGPKRGGHSSEATQHQSCTCPWGSGPRRGRRSVGKRHFWVRARTASPLGTLGQAGHCGRSPGPSSSCCAGSGVQDPGGRGLKPRTSP